MRGTVHSGEIDWVQFTAPDDPNVTWRVNLSFMLSRYSCIYGRGCPSLAGRSKGVVDYSIGCCTDGFYVRDQIDMRNIEENIALLTKKDWDDDLRKEVKKNGWTVNLGESETFNPSDGEALEYEIKSRTVNGRCVFSNRGNGSSGKPGCAFHHMAARTGRRPTDTKPFICWSLPLRVLPEGGGEIFTLTAWDADAWGPRDGDGTHDSWMMWFCMDSPDAFVGEKTVLKSLRDEIVELMGQPSYDHLCAIAAERKKHVFPMPGELVNDGRPVLPELVPQIEEAVRTRPRR